MTTDFYQKITDMQGTVEDLLRRVPGLSELLEHGDRREADRFLREHLVRQFEEVHNRFSRLQEAILAMNGGLAFMDKAKSVDTRLRTFIDKIDSAAVGYVGVFDAVKINSSVLERVYAFDNALLIYRDQFSMGLDALDSAVNAGGEGVQGILRQLDDIASEANTMFSQRVEVLQGLGNSE